LPQRNSPKISVIEQLSTPPPSIWSNFLPSGSLPWEAILEKAHYWNWWKIAIFGPSEYYFDSGNIQSIGILLEVGGCFSTLVAIANFGGKKPLD